MVVVFGSLQSIWKKIWDNKIMYYWCYFQNNKCIQSIPEIKSNPLTPMQFVLLKANGIIRFLCEIPDGFDPVGKNENELKEYIR